MYRLWTDGIKEWKNEDGYFTVEAVSLVTLVFLLMFAVMMSGLYICDLNQARSFLNQRVTELSRNEEEYESSQQMEDRKQMQRQLFVTKLIEYSISKTGERVKGEMKLSMRMNVPVITDWFGSLWTDTFSLTVDVGNNVEQMRRWKLIE